MRQKKLYYSILLAIAMALALASNVKGIRPNYVYDEEGLLFEYQEDQLEEFLTAIDTNYSVEIVVVTLKVFPNNITGDDAKYVVFNDIELDNRTGIGNPETDKGVLFLMSWAENYVGIEVGYGLEGDLTDAQAGRILDEFIPIYLEDTYKGFEYVVEAIAGHVGYEEPSQPQGEDNTMTYIFIGVLVFVGIAFLWIVSSWNQRAMKKARSVRRLRDADKMKYNSLQSEIYRTRENYEQKLKEAEARLKPKPVEVHQCPHCNDTRRVQVQNSKPDEEVRNGWWWYFVGLSLMCLTCGTYFGMKQNEKRVEGIKTRRSRLKREAKEAEEERQRRRKIQEEEDERRARDRRRRMSSPSRSSSPSSSPSRSNFGGGRSGGGGASRTIRP